MQSNRQAAKAALVNAAATVRLQAAMQKIDADAQQVMQSSQQAARGAAAASECSGSSGAACNDKVATADRFSREVQMSRQKNDAGNSASCAE